MLKRSIIAAILLTALLLLAPHPASARLRVGVTVGTPGYYSYPYYYPSYSYNYLVYSYPYVYTYPAYRSYYVAPRYVYTYRRHHHHDDWDRHWRH
jgi:hypothetical protein